jgi:hypothetical protein
VPITPTPPPSLKKQYPHVDDVEDWRAQQTIRLLWDRIFDLEARLQGTEATQGDLVNVSNDHDDTLTEISEDLDDLEETVDTGGGSPPVVVAADGYYAPVTNGDPVSPEILFDGTNGEVIMGWVPL